MIEQVSAVEGKVASAMIIGYLETIDLVLGWHKSWANCKYNAKQCKTMMQFSYLKFTSVSYLIMWWAASLSLESEEVSALRHVLEASSVLQVSYLTVETKSGRPNLPVRKTTLKNPKRPQKSALVSYSLKTVFKQVNMMLSL